LLCNQILHVLTIGDNWFLAVFNSNKGDPLLDEEDVRKACTLFAANITVRCNV